MDHFRASRSAHPQAPQESFEVYAAEINKLVLEVFPDYGDMLKLLVRQVLGTFPL